MYENGIKHTPEPLYPQDDEFNPTGKMRADWLINDDAYVEFFDLMQDQKYREKRDKKVSLTKKIKYKINWNLWYKLFGKRF